MIRRIIALIVAVAAMATAAGVAVVSASFALFALLRDYIGPAGAAAAVCASAGVLILLIGLIAFARFKRRPAPKIAPSTGKSALADRLADVLRERPVAAAGAAVAAGLVAWRNPQLASVLLRIFDPAASARGRRP